MHPIERLRYVARSGWGGPASLGAEAAYALAELAEQEPAALLTACRRLLERNPGCGPLWWVCARVLCAGDAWAEAAHCAQLLEDDPTEQLLEVELYGLRAVRHGGVGEVASADVVVVAADVIGPAGMVIDAGDCGLLEAARAVGTDIWVSGGVGRVLPARLWQAMSVRLESPPRPSRTAASSWFDPVASSAVVVDLQAVRKVAGPTGVHETPRSLSRPDCPEPPELVARW
ncbi:MAG TPA: hypothetical protein VK428_14560 [Acidimicrobiales bacterium]|nr:hypothetical protein [Acidimicrobiales bacterium]